MYSTKEGTSKTTKKKKTTNEKRVIEKSKYIKPFWICYGSLLVLFCVSLWIAFSVLSKR